MLGDNFNMNVTQYLPLRDVVFNALREAILRGELYPGERLMEKQLAEKMGVSRTPIREAIRKLELEGLVIMVPRKGAQVAQITEKEVKDVLEVRATLEELAVKLACEKITKDQLDEMKMLLEEFHNLGDSTEVEKMVKIDIKFHGIIFESTNNDKLIQIVNNLGEQLYRYRVAYLNNKDFHEIIKQEHTEILKAIENKDVELAVKKSLEHIRNQEESVIRMFREESQN